MEPGALRVDSGFWGSPRHAPGAVPAKELSRMREPASLPLDSPCLVSGRELNTIQVRVGSSPERAQAGAAVSHDLALSYPPSSLLAANSLGRQPPPHLGHAFPIGVLAQNYSLPECLACLLILGVGAEGAPPNHDRIIELDSFPFPTASSPKQVALETKLKY